MFSLAPKWSQNISRAFGFDLRSLAMFRVLLGLFLLANLFARAFDITAFYSDDGVMPRSLLLKYANIWQFSVYLMNGKTYFQALLFLISAFFAFTLLIGYRTRLSTLISWFLFASLEMRNGDVLSAGDRELRLILFWCLFLPLGAKFSVDEGLNTEHESSPKASATSHRLQVFSAATLGYTLQIALIYWFTAILKTGNDWRGEWSAVYYALNLEMFANPLAKYFLLFPQLVKWLTPAVLYFEYFGPFFLFVPVFNRLTGFIRTLGVFNFFMLHLGLGLCLDLGTFPIIAAIAFVPFLPEYFWSTLFCRKQNRTGQGIKIYYDRDCGFCKKGVLILRSFLALPAAEIHPAQNDRQANARMLEKNSWVVTDSTSQATTEFQAFVALVNESPWLHGLAPIFRLDLFNLLGLKIYRLVANHRKFFSHLTRPLSFKPLRLDLSACGNICAALLAIYVLCWNIQHVRKSFHFPERLKIPGYILRLEQYWAMFAPTVPRDDGWIVIPGQLANGEYVDLVRGDKPVNWEKPPLLSKIYKNSRWRAYHRPLFYSKFQEYRSTYARYLCHTWNRQHAGTERELIDLEMYLMRKMNLPDYQVPVPEKVFLSRYNCKSN